MGSIRRSRLPYIVALLLVIVTYACYRQVGECGFVHYDDPDYVSENAQVQHGLNWADLTWAFKPNTTGLWQPLVWLSYMLDSQFGGVDPAAFHQTNLLLHIANVVLLFALLLRVTGVLWPSAFVAALFAVHPQHVESVAWVTERKDVMSTLFWLATALAYVWYANRPGLKRYGVVIALYTLGLMAKPMLVTLPVILLLLDYWPLRRLQVTGCGLQVSDAEGRLPVRKSESLISSALGARRLVLEKAPLLALAAAFSVIAYIAEKHGGTVDVEGVYSPGVRLANAAVSYWVYIWKTIWPVKLAVFYPHPRASLPVWQVAASAFALLLATYAVIRARRKLPYVAVGWLWYLITLLPVIGLIQIGMCASADRYTYIPHIGLFVAAAWAGSDLLRRALKSGARKWVAATGCLLAVGIAAALATQTCRQVRYWRNDIALFTRAVEAVPGNYLAQDNLGTALLDQGDTQAAMEHYREAIRVEPKYMHARRNLASTLVKEGRNDEAIECLRAAAAEAVPNNAGALTDLGTLYWQQSKLHEAEATLREAVRAAADYAPAHRALGVVLADQGRLDEAIAHLAEAVRLDPKDQGYAGDLDHAKRIKSGEQ